MGPLATQPFFGTSKFIQAPTPKSAGHEVSKEVGDPQNTHESYYNGGVGPSPTWMSREVDGSMASNLVISPTFINGVYWGELTHLLTFF